MKRDIQKLTKEKYDVLVIGGGINGAAIAHMSALNGLKTALLEKGDFASGTSSKSTKLIHGGLRYLENFELGLVRESLRERFVQLNSAPHLVRPLRFVIPVYKTDKRPLWMVRLGVWLYDFLSWKHIIEKHQLLSIEEVCRILPGIEQESLVGGVTYSDAQMNDARLCLENILSASQKGANVANYVEAYSLIQEDGKVVGVKVRDGLNQQQFEVRAKKVVCAVGPWTDSFIQKENSQLPAQIRTTKGVHIVVKGCMSKDAILIPAQGDRRVFFIIPWMENTLIGTTDTDYEGLADDVTVDQKDIDYLVAETRRILPHVDLNEGNIITTFAGLRPLVREQGAPGKISRKHAIKKSHLGLIYVVGGKYTTYRKIAEDVVGQLIKTPRMNTQKYFPVYGSGVVKESPESIGRKYGLDSSVVQSLMDFYGTRFVDVCLLIDKDPSLKNFICTCSSVIRAQIVYAMETEMANTIEDIMERRLMLGYTDCQSGECRAAIKEILQKN